MFFFMERICRRSLGVRRGGGSSIGSIAVIILIFAGKGVLWARSQPNASGRARPVRYEMFCGRNEIERPQNAGYDPLEES